MAIILYTAKDYGYTVVKVENQRTEGKAMKDTLLIEFHVWKIWHETKTFVDRKPIPRNEIVVICETLDEAMRAARKIDSEFDSAQLVKCIKPIK